MRKHSMIVATVVAVFSSACARRVPEPAGLAPGTPHVSWIIMRGDRDNPDREFVCQSDRRNDCILPVSRPDAPVFSDVHLYYHGARVETKYTGSIQIGFFQGSADETHSVQVNTTVPKTQSIVNQSITDDVTSTPGTYAITFALDATLTGSGKTQPIREQVPVVVK
jgi:hypothetical protein